MSRSVEIEVDGIVVARSRNLRGILAYHRHGRHSIRPVYVVRASAHPAEDAPACTAGMLFVTWSDGAECRAPFASYAALKDWLMARRDWKGVRWVNNEGPL